MIWVKKEIDGLKAKELAGQYGIDMIFASILVRRNIINPEEIKFFLEDDVRFLHNPFCFHDMQKVVERLSKAVADKEKILVYGDRDVDGITSTVLLVESLSSFGGLVDWKVPLGDEDYGLSRQDVDAAAGAGVSLLVTVDCGISNFKEVEYARLCGIDVIILDHHNPQSSLPDAFAIINSKVEGSGYPFRDLCGCGVVSKVDWALLFSKSRYYNRPLTLLQITPLHESFSVEAVRLVNLVERERLRENMVPTVESGMLKKLSDFSAGTELCVFDRKEQEKLIHKAFGSCPVLSDFEPVLKEAFPLLEGKSLLKIRELSRIGRYVGKPISEIEMFKSLYVSSVLRIEKDLLAPALRRLDLVALGTIADLMPLVNENRIVVKQGLAIMALFERNGLRELLIRKNLLGKEISAKDIAWQISPIINASGRLGEPDKAVELLLATEKEKLESLSKYIYKLNEKRKEMGDLTWKKMLAVADDSYKKTDGKFVLVTDPAIHRGITGILATKMVGYYKVPACVIAQLPHKAVGSLRSVGAFSLAPFMLHFTDLFTDYGGHDMAAGFNLPLTSLDALTERFYKVVETISLPREKEESIYIDAEIPKNYLTPDLFKTVQRLSPFGEANPPVLFFTPGLVIENCEVIGKKEQVHLKMLVNTGKYRFPAMLWNGVDLYGSRFKIGDTVDLIYRMHKNTFMNTETLQLIVSDIDLSGGHDVKTEHLEESFFDAARRSEY